VVKDIRESLSPQTKEVFYMTLAGLTPGEIAHLLGVTEANIRGHVMRGREVLKSKRDLRGRID
jgi:DNA-directed RNA polymerase specialized sigma24 family protein